MHDMNISVQTLLACVLWGAGVGLVILAIIDQLNGVAPAGIGLILTACMVDIRERFQRLEHRELKAFELGRQLSSVRDRND